MPQRMCQRVHRFIKHPLCLPVLWLTVAMARGYDSSAADQEHLTPHDCPPFIYLSLSASIRLSLLISTSSSFLAILQLSCRPSFQFCTTRQPLIHLVYRFSYHFLDSSPLVSYHLSQPLPSACLSMVASCTPDVAHSLQLLALWSCRRRRERNGMMEMIPHDKHRRSNPYYMWGGYLKRQGNKKETHQNLQTEAWCRMQE